MSHVEAAEAAIAKIDAATTKQGEQLAEIANLTQEVSDDIDAIIAAMPEGMPEDFVAKLQALADRSQSVSDSLDAHATFSKNIAAKWPVNPPVPTPVPDIPDPVDE